MQEWLVLASALGGAFITGIFSFLGVYYSNNSGKKLLAYRMEQLEKKIEAISLHADKIQALETQVATLTERIKLMEHHYTGGTTHERLSG